MTPSGNGLRLQERLELQATHELEQRLVLGPNAGKFHSFVTQPAQEQRPRRIETAELAQVDRAGLMLFQRLLQDLLGFLERVDIEHALEGQPIALTTDGDCWRGRLRSGSWHG